MWIAQIFPQTVGAKDTLRHRLVAEATARGLEIEATDGLVNIAPASLLNAECFLDNMTGLWRYEFGLPYKLDGQLVWGTHMWIPVGCLVSALCCVSARLTGDKQVQYLARLADADRHQATLVEMIPGSRLDAAIPADFEVAGLGAGNRTIDWSIGPHAGRRVLLDVKRRTRDFIEQAQQIHDDTAVAPEPQHVPVIMFLSVEDKFIPSDPDVRLQGAWIVTDIQQDQHGLRAAFDMLDLAKVHFAILGDWGADAYILSRRPPDEEYLCNLLHLEPSGRFTFVGQNEV